MQKLQQALLIYFIIVFVPSWSSAENLTTPVPTTVEREFNYSDLKECELSSVELHKKGEVNEYVEPCIVEDIHPSVNETTNRSAIITIIQVTRTTCGPWRDGSIIGVQKLNEANNGTGVAIGFQNDYYVKFRLVSIVSGNQVNLGADEYDRRHVMLLNSTLEALKPQYIVGTCSWHAAIEKGPALAHKTILSTQVGPPSFYEDKNPYVFGIHINSDNYPQPAVQELRFFAENLPGGVSSQPMRVIYRTKSSFFNSTCRAAIDSAMDSGLTDVEAFEYDPFGDEDGDGIVNEKDTDFLQSLADEACPPSLGSSEEGPKPALFLCTLEEHEVILARWKENGCRPVALWATPSTWTWAFDNQEVIPYFQGGGQWHKAFQYKDDYFDSGQKLLDYAGENGYESTQFDLVVSYAIPVLYSQHIIASYRIDDDPDPLQDFNSEKEYELLRRDFVILKADTIFGPVTFDENQRNVGRGAAATQWLPGNTTSSLYENKLTSPLLQAEAKLFIPVPGAIDCDSGEFVSTTAIQNDDCMLCNKCDSCPIDTFTLRPNQQLQCNACPAGSTTTEKEGQESCTIIKENLLPGPILVFAYIGVAIVWLLSAVFIYWIIKNKTDPVVRIGQPEFLILICVGAIISSSSVIFLSLQAGYEKDTKWASVGCMTAPFLYGIGWVIEYSSMSAKTYRLFKMMNNPRLQRIKITAFDMYKIVLGALVLDVTVLTAWAIVCPLEYVRSESNRNIYDGLVTIETHGECKMTKDLSIFAFAGPLIGLHGLLMIATNYLLYMVRNVEGRYQEQKYVAMASAYAFEVLVIGIPVLAAVQDSVETRFIVLSSIVFLSDMGILCFVFIPKMMFLKEGLPEGVRVNESITVDTMQKAKNREVAKKAMSYSIYSRSSNPTNNDQSSMKSMIESGIMSNEPIPEVSSEEENPGDSERVFGSSTGTVKTGNGFNNKLPAEDSSNSSITDPTKFSLEDDVTKIEDAV
eukprot:CAMPEP_0195283310 /NCGR_PEP_ID=MMETSP0707-20130614/1897_1 /TAXON_ID=33640 /ORGANISM="Asterionellopsis glacialis, Strain CCMP134" /LENGTH=975 /DNA_ID=CAMNT_0040342455 /DNA_START=118 /DNA_END=3045 /DNA_ORIENTATION=-